MKDLREMSVSRLAAVTASNAPAPGGGSISALAGALSAALTGMVATLSQGDKYHEVKREMVEIAEEAAQLRTLLLDAMQADTEAFSLYMDALALPKTTEEEKAIRREAMQNGLKAAAMTPLKVAEVISAIFCMIEVVIKKGNPNAVTDALVASMMARSGILGALFNVKVNLASIKDEAFVANVEQKLKALEKTALEGEARIFSLSEFSSDVGN